MGNFYAALVLDGTKSMDVTDGFEVQEPVEGLTDSSGVGDKVFGMRFNNFRELLDVGDEYSDYTKSTDAGLQAEADLHYYQTSPFLFQTGDKLTVVFSDTYVNFGVAAARVK